MLKVHRIPKLKTVLWTPNVQSVNSKNAKGILDMAIERRIAILLSMDMADSSYAKF